jgi:hypothetical protein
MSAADPSGAVEWTVRGHLDAASPAIVDLYHRFIAVTETLGPFTYSVTKSNITLKGSRRGFAGVVLKRAALNGYFDHQRALPDVGHDPRLLSVAPYTKRLYVHQFQITAWDQLDATFRRWLGEAYDVGQGAHLAP